MGKHKKRNRSRPTVLQQGVNEESQISSTTSPVSQPQPTSLPSHPQVLPEARDQQVTTVHAAANSQDKQSYDKCMRNDGKEGSLKIPCLGRCLELGILYNSHSEMFLRDETLWKKDIIKKHTTLENCKSIQFEVITDDSFNKKAVSLGMEPSTKLSFLSGLISVEGAAKYLENNKSSCRQARVALKYYSNTFFEQLLLDQVQLETFQSQDLVSKGPYTHVVTGVQYGLDAVFVFDRELSPEEDCQAVEEILAAAIRKTLLSHREGRPILVNEDEGKEINKFHCTYHGDINVLKNPATFDDAISVAKSLPSHHLKTTDSQGDYGVPKIAYLQPLNEFAFVLPQPVQRINSTLADEIQALLEGFNGLQLTASDLIKGETCSRYLGIKQQITKFKQWLSDFGYQLKKKLADILLKVREGRAEQVLLSDYVNNLKKTPFDISKLEIWLEYKRQEAIILTQSLLPLKNCAFVYQERELEQFLHDRNTKYILTLTFGMIASNSHPYLEEMSDYLNNSEDSSNLDESFKEHWFQSDNMNSSFRRQVDLFAKFASVNKENAKLKCLVVATSGRKAVVHSPGETFLYVDGYRKSFQPPSSPGAAKLATDAEYEMEIKWEVPHHGAKDIQCYSIACKFHSDDDNAANWRSVVTEFDETRYRITQLQPATSYVFKVAAVCEAGQGAFSSPSLPLSTKPLPSLAERSLEDCKLLSPASADAPAWYLVPLKETYHDKKMRLRKYEIGTFSTRVLITKVMLIVGATGSGKTTLINGMINFLFGTQMDDKFRLKLIDEALQGSQANSQTQYITSYTIHWQDGSRIAYNLVIVDTPGYGDTRGIAHDDHVTHQIKEFFEMKGTAAIDHLDAVGFVAQASAVRLTDTQKYVFDAILSIFGCDIADNIFMMLTFADGRLPPALDAINAHNLPYKSYFKFNNSVFTQLSPKTDHVSSESADANMSVTETFDALFWKLAEESFIKFFSDVFKVEAKSLKLTKEVLNERRILECTIENFQQRITSGLNHLMRMRQELAIVEQFEAEKSANKEFTRTILVPKTKRVEFNEVGRYVTNCLNCGTTCHSNCRITDNAQKYHCIAMNNPGHEDTTCRICASQCTWDKHYHKNYYFEQYTEEEIVTIEDLKKKYDHADKSLSEKDNLLIGMYNEYNKVQIAVLKDIETVRKSLQRLDKIAMKRNPMTTVGYIDVLIKSTKSERKPGWEQRLDQLYNSRERAEMIQKMESLGKHYDPFQEFQKEINRVADMTRSNKRRVTEKIKSFFGFRRVK